MVLKSFGDHFQVEKSESDDEVEKTEQARLLLYFSFKFPSIGSYLLSGLPLSRTSLAS